MRRYNVRILTGLPSSRNLWSPIWWVVAKRSLRASCLKRRSWRSVLRLDWPMCLFLVPLPSSVYVWHTRITVIAEQFTVRTILRYDKSASDKQYNSTRVKITEMVVLSVSSHTRLLVKTSTSRRRQNNSNKRTLITCQGMFSSRQTEIITFSFEKTIRYRRLKFLWLNALHM